MFVERGRWIPCWLVKEARHRGLQGLLRIWPAFLSVMDFGRANRAERTIPPAESKLLLSAKIPSIGTSPTVGFSAYRPARFAGVMSDPIVSVPIARELKPEATLTAEPVDDPPGAESSQCSFFFAMCRATYGDWHWPPTADHPGGIEGFFNPQNSVKLALPSIINPLRINRSTIVAFFLGVHPTNA